MDHGVLRADSGESLAGANWSRLATRRLTWLAKVCLVVAIVGGLLGLFREDNIGMRAGTSRPMILAPVWFLAALGLFLSARAARLSVHTRLNIGLAFLVLTCVGIGLFRHWLPYAPTDVVRGVSPVTLFVLFYAVVVPEQPVRMAVAAIACAVADVVAMLFTFAALKNPTPPADVWVWLFAPNVIAVVLAVVTSRFLHDLSETIRRVREMGAYRLVERLGSGGMGEVWRAEHRSLARPAAIKLVRPELLGAHDSAEAQHMVQRFEREAKATAALSSPHTIAVYDYGRDDDGRFYYVMELLSGMDLETLVKHHGKLPQERVVYMLLQICDSLRDAHSRGVIHRDIKPANLFVCERGADKDYLKVLDFGLVKIEATGEDATQLTAAESMMGTSTYMAPEIAQGDEATASSDIYALGCVAYWLLTGQLVFPGRDQAMKQVLAHIHDTPVAPSELATVDETLELVVLRCLDKQPRHRPEDMATLESLLRETELADGWSVDHARDWWANAGERTASEISCLPTVPHADLEAAPTEVG